MSKIAFFFFFFFFEDLSISVVSTLLIWYLKLTCICSQLLQMVSVKMKRNHVISYITKINSILYIHPEI